MTKYMRELTQERLKEVLDYNPETGIFTWRINRVGVRAGDIAGSKHSNDRYLAIKIDGKSYRSHRLAWFYVYGYWPKYLDHKNRIKDANWIDNLREISLRNIQELTQKRLREVLDYNPETGIFTWKISRGSINAGAIAGTKRNDGYIHIKIDWKKYLAHRLAWFYVYGYWPKYIDHINRITDANWIENLREISQSDNMKNRKININNTSGIKGVSYHKDYKKWCAQIRNMNKNICFGYFDNKIDAARVRFEAERKYGWEDYDIYESSAYRYIRMYEENLLLENSMQECLYQTNDFDDLME